MARIGQRSQAQRLIFCYQPGKGALEQRQIQGADKKRATTQIEMDAFRPRTLVAPDLALAK